MISILLPSRKRGPELLRMVSSIWTTKATPKIEIVIRFDEDDTETIYGFRNHGDWTTLDIKILVGPRIRKRTQYWNECFTACSGDIVCQANDDCVWRDDGWDLLVENAFAECPDQILVVHGDHLGGYDGRLFGPHPFTSRKWVETVGYFTPPHYSSDHGDTFLNDVANALGRRRFLPFVLEHMHFGTGKSELDETYRDRLKDHDEDNPEALYVSHLPERVEAANKLGAVMVPPRRIIASRFSPHRGAGECPKCQSQSTVFQDNGIACNSCGHRWAFRR
jgi:hypothetical protein